MENTKLPSFPVDTAVGAPTMTRSKLGLVALATAGAISLGAPGAFASTIDPQVYVCTGCTAPAGLDPNPINPASINIGFAGNHTAVSPLLVIVGVPDAGTLPGGGSISAPTLSLPSGVNAAAGGTYYGLNSATSGNLTGTLEGHLTSSSGSAYVTSGLNEGSGGGASESFVNWTTNPYPGGGTNPDTGVTDFALYAYAINFALNSGAGGNSPINIDLGGLGIGDYVIAYNCETAESPKCTDGAIGATPFTNAGVDLTTTTTTTTRVPEPASMALLGTALAGLGLARRRRRRI